MERVINHIKNNYGTYIFLIVVHCIAYLAGRYVDRIGGYIMPTQDKKCKKCGKVFTVKLDVFLKVCPYCKATNYSAIRGNT
jgi:predicted Zn-ribbon and HTH transcriptional regulator